MVSEDVGAGLAELAVARLGVVVIYQVVWLYQYEQHWPLDDKIEHILSESRMNYDWASES